MLTLVKALFVKSRVSKLASDNNRKTTLLGLIAAGLIVAQLNWEKLIQGDATECGKAAGAIVTALIGYYTNRPDKR